MYPIWIPNTYTLTYILDGGSFNASTTQLFKYGSGDAISSEIPVKNGYVFTGWKWNDVTMQPGDKIPKNWGDFTLTAQWSKPYKKGSILNIEGTKYIVLEEKEDDKALVMPVNSIGNRAFQSTSRSDNLNFNTYEGSEIDSYLENNWYNSLPSAMKMAIQATNIKQASYSDNYLNAKQDTGPNGQLYNTISRHVYLPSVEEISKVVNLSNSEKIKSFLNGTSSWTRDSYQRSALPVMILDADDGYLSNNDVYMSYGVRPTFVIDLSKIDYSAVG